MKISLDLLPQNKKNEIRRERIFREIMHDGLLLLFPVFVLIVILVNVFHLLKIQRAVDFRAYDEERTQDGYRKLEKYEENFKNMNEASSFLIRIQSGHLHWSNMLKNLNRSVPSGIALDSLATKEYDVYLVGKAKTRDNLLEFKNGLEHNDCFENVNVPLSDFAVKENVEFQIDFTVKQNCLKE